MMKLDSKNCQILNLLQKDCRMSLTDISKKVDLSIDSVKKRINKMLKNCIFYPKIQLRPRNFGFNNVVDIKIKLHNYTQKDIDNFLKYLIENPAVAEIFSISGEWDFSIVIISRDTKDLGMMTKSIRDKFSKIINNWSESLTTTAYKFEYYDVPRLMGHTKVQDDDFEFYEAITNKNSKTNSKNVQK